MNTSGIEHPNILQRFIESEEKIEECRRDYYLSEWIDCFYDTDFVYIPLTKIFEYEDLSNGVVNEYMSQHSNIEWFARLDPLSSKPVKPYTCAEEIKENFEASDRTNPYIGTRVVLREWVHHLQGEFRCFIHDGKLRGISVNYNLSPQDIELIKSVVDKITFYTSYDDYTVDFGWDIDRLVMIEINTPVYLLATSGNFDLTLPFDYEVLLGEYIPELINYPVIKN